MGRRGDDVLIEAWLAEHRPRRFQMGESATRESLRAFLNERGYEVEFTWKAGGRATIRQIGARGRPPTVSMRELLAFVDELRLTEGMEPILKPDSDVLRELEALAA